MGLKCLIVDDEQLARQIIIEFISKIPQLEVAASCKNALEANIVLQKEPIDLLFLDINMPDLTGLDFLQSLTHTPPVILTTAYEEYALKSYEYNVVDYLLKPFSFHRFLKAINKLPVSQKGFGAATEPVASLNIKANNKLYRINKSDILYIEGLKEYLSIFTVKGEKLVTLDSLKKYEDLLGPDGFARVHKSYIVALQHIQYLEGNFLQVKNKQIPIGKSYKGALLARL